MPIHQTPDYGGTDGTDLILSALHHLGGIYSTSRAAPRSPNPARQKADLREWAANLGLLLNPETIVPRLERGGQEHDIFSEGERIFKMTRDGVFGLSPGIELVLVSSSQDARRFHLWEATPLEYLKRLALHNDLVPGINRLEGVLSQPDGELAIVTSQPRFDIVPVTELEIDEWFAAQNFDRLTHAAYFRREDRLGVFDAHDKNVIRAGGTLIPFDVIPCHPEAGFLRFVEDTLARNHELHLVRKVSDRVGT